MISFNKHKEFKDTEIGRIPKEWKVVEVAKLGEVVTGTTPSTKNKKYWENGEYLFVTPTDFNKKKIIKITERKVSKEGIEKARIISKNSVMVTCIASIGEVALSSHDCITNQQINTIICKEGIDPEFVYYFLLNSKARLKRWAGITTSPIIKKSFFEKFPILLPPISEQQKIAEVLSTVDEAIQKTDEAIRITTRLKKGMMHELLTKGIGHKNFKDTEIGRIPKEWKVVEVAKLGEVVTGTTPSTKNKKYWENGEYLFVTPTDFNKKKIIKITERKVSKEGIEKARIISKNSVMVTCIASIGEVALSSHDCITNQQINTIICKEGIDPEFVYYFLLNSKARLKRWAGITTSPIIKKSFFEKFPILLPPISEQQKIAEVLSTTDNKLEFERRRKAKLETVKKGLMNDLLTGKKRVK